jgi:hypothetical protein
MRLIRIGRRGQDELSLVEYTDNVPPYAILSHRWEADHEEVAFGDMVEVRGGNKKGFRKTRDCAEQAAKDAYEFF